ncbi:hypothetical protein D3C73_1521720 [compost metagenome]
MRNGPKEAWGWFSLLELYLIPGWKKALLYFLLSQLQISLYHKCKNWLTGFTNTVPNYLFRSGLALVVPYFLLHYWKDRQSHPPFAITAGTPVWNAGR